MRNQMIANQLRFTKQLLCKHEWETVLIATHPEGYTFKTRRMCTKCDEIRI